MDQSEKLERKYDIELSKVIEKIGMIHEMDYPDYVLDIHTDVIVRRKDDDGLS